MKKIFLMLLWSATCVAQTYVPFPDSNATWNVVDAFKDFGNLTNYRNYKFQMMGDTTIQQQNYHKIYETFSQTRYVGGIRETPQKEIFFRADTASQDLLLYKFGLNVGDSARIYRLGQWVSIRTLSIDSVLVGNRFRKRYTMTTPQSIPREQWIEGIGSVKGLFFPLWWLEFENSYQLYCFELNGQLVYQSSNALFWNRCYNVFIWGTDELSVDVTVQPNPVSHFLQFSWTGLAQDALSLKIYNTAGQMLLRQPVQSNVPISVETLPNGLYLYELTHQNAKKLGKFMVLK
jgi:Secretion system C-terminal sorting domain